MELRTRLALVDPHPALRHGIECHLRRTSSTVVVTASVPSVEGLVRQGGEQDVALLDACPHDDALRALAELRERGVRVLLYTAEERVVPLRRAVEAGAAGVLLKRDPLALLSAAVEDVAGGDFVCSATLAPALLNPAVPALSARQVQVLRAIDQGLDRRAVGRLLRISDGAVKTYLARVREKYQQHGHQPGNSHHLIHLASVDGYVR
ncbi:response regulator [Nocardioides nitrophenolicus]|uniref:response regulator n=1 Tax=Nocardioides nitrophenolicus TaxID=60489 RepID=UPI00195AD8D2|nr:response regulator [Nocardioides nitrophenolicus]MBM7516705.1 DNA-binding NarL/FixJ family response regulator [Nocardioides nitrophenolicus]